MMKPFLDSSVPGPETGSGALGSACGWSLVTSIMNALAFYALRLFQSFRSFKVMPEKSSSFAWTPQPPTSSEIAITISFSPWASGR